MSNATTRTRKNPHLSRPPKAEAELEIPDPALIRMPRTGAHIRKNPHLSRPLKAEELEVPDPVFIRMPRTGTKCPYTSLARSTLDLLVRPQALNDYDPPVKSKLMRQTGDRAKIQLINFKSLMAYLDSLPDGGQQLKKEVTP